MLASEEHGSKRRGDSKEFGDDHGDWALAPGGPVSEAELGGAGGFLRGSSLRVRELQDGLKESHSAFGLKEGRSEILGLKEGPAYISKSVIANERYSPIVSAHSSSEDGSRDEEGKASLEQRERARNSSLDGQMIELLRGVMSDAEGMKQAILGYRRECEQFRRENEQFRRENEQLRNEQRELRSLVAGLAEKLERGSNSITGVQRRTPDVVKEFELIDLHDQYGFLDWKILVRRFIHLAGVGRATQMRIEAGTDSMVDLVTERIRASISKAEEFKPEWKMDHLCDILYHMQQKHNKWAEVLRSKLKKAFENFDNMQGKSVSWFINELEKRRADLTSVGVEKTDQDMGDLLRNAGASDPRFSLVVKSIVNRVGSWTYSDLKLAMLEEEYELTDSARGSEKRQPKPWPPTNRLMILKCANCASDQHTTWKCNKPRNPNPPCWTCEKPGHKAKHCHGKQANGDGPGAGAGSGQGGGGGGAPREACRPFQQTGACRFGDNCRNLHAGDGGASGGAGGGGAGRTQRVGIMMPAPRTEERPPDLTV